MIKSIKKNCAELKSIAMPAVMFLLGASPALAQGDTGGLSGLKSQLDVVGKGAYGEQALARPLPEIIGSYISAALGLLGVVLVILIIYAGVLWMTAGGNADQVKKAKQLIVNAVIGIIIIMAAYAITNFVVGAVISGTTGQAS